MEQLQHAEIRDFPARTVAYIRHTGPYRGDEELFNQLFNRLFSRAGPNGLMERKSTIPWPFIMMIPV